MGRLDQGGRRRPASGTEDTRMTRKPAQTAADRLAAANEKRHLEALARGSRKAADVEKRRARRTGAASAGAEAASLPAPVDPPPATRPAPGRKAPPAKPASAGEAKPAGDPSRPGAATRFWKGGLRGLLGRDSD